jgi:hypothetical protein
MNWKIALALSAPVTAIGALAGGCVNNECTRADDQIETCSQQVQLNAPSNNMTDNQVCTPGTARYCQSVCINTATCSEINASLCLGQVACPETSADAGGISNFTNCMIQCTQAADGGS